MGLFGRDLKYDLAHNKLNLRIESLKQQSLTLFIQKLCRDGDITDYINENIKYIRVNKETNDNFTMSIELAELLTKKNIYESVYFKSSDLKQFRTFIKETICFLVIQICDLLRKETVAKEEENNVSLLLKNLTLTSQGTIDLKSTVYRILKWEQPLLSHSCELACYYFIKEEIVNNHYQMIINEDSDYFVGHDKEEAVKSCLNFWKWFILNYDKDNLKLALRNPIEMKRMTVSMLANDEKKKFIFNMFDKAVKYNNEIAVYYLWNTYISKVKEEKDILRKALRISIANPTHTNINMFLLSHLESRELDKRIKYKYFSILINIVRNVRWHSLFAVALNKLKTYLGSYSFELLLGTLTDSHFIDFTSQINITIDYINSFRDNIKESLSKKTTYIYEVALAKPFMYAKKDLVTSLLSLGNELEKKEFLKSNNGMDLFAEAIKRGNLEFVEYFLLDHVSGDDVLELKQNLYYWKSETMYDHFIEIRQFEKLREVIDWLSEVIRKRERLHDFKDRMLSQHNGLYIRQMIFPANVDSDINPFPSINEFLFWCFETEESATLFKRKILLCPNQTLPGTKNLISCYEELKTSILKSKWNLLGKLFHWKYFPLNDRRAFHQKLFNDNTFLSKLILEASKAKSFLESFSDFLTTHLTPSNSEMNDIRRRILNGIVKKYPDISNYLLSWYENQISWQELLLFIESFGIVFEEKYILKWLKPQDDMPS